jgi:hypothetical protein
MTIIVYRMYHERDCYELTLSDNREDFIQDKDWENLVNAVDDGYPFEIIKCTETEFDVFREVLTDVFDIFDTDEVAEDEIIVKRRDEIIDYKDAVDLCYDEIKELKDKIRSLQYDMEIYDNIYYDKYHCHITEKYNG